MGGAREEEHGSGWGGVVGGRGSGLPVIHLPLCGEAPQALG